MCLTHTMRSPLVHDDTNHAGTHKHTHSSQAHEAHKHADTRRHAVMSEWQMKEVNCLGLTSSVEVTRKEGKLICWLSLLVSEAISHLSFAPCFLFLSYFSLLKCCTTALCLWSCKSFPNYTYKLPKKHLFMLFSAHDWPIKILHTKLFNVPNSN